MARKKKPFLENITIEATAAEGNGLAHVDGKVIFVEQAIPGDVVDIQINKVRSGYSSGYIKKVVSPSPHRLKPFCEHFGVCGGCAWQSLPYQMQLDFKQQQVIDQLTRIGHLRLPEVSPILGSEKTEYYRNKLEYTFSNRRWVVSMDEAENLSDTERLGLGFHIGGHFDKVLDIKQCHLQREPSNSIRLFIKQYAIDNSLSFFDLRESRGFMRNLMIRTTSTGQVMLLVSFGGDAAEEHEKVKALLDAVVEHFPEITSLYYVINPKGNDTIGDLECILFKGEEAVFEKMENLCFKIGPKSFYQTNSEQAYRLYSVVRSFVKEGIEQTGCASPTIYDLYTGTGTIALFLSSLAGKVVGIEYVPEAIEDARVNARLNNVKNAEFFAGDMKDVLSSDFIKEHGHPDIVVLDPPRAGIHPDVAQVLIDAAPDRMVYVSCNPATQARDLAIFAKKYDIVHVQSVDMFPHTTHVENVVALVKKAKKPVRQEIIDYVEAEVLPCYAAYDKGHQEDHIRAVIEQADYLSQYYDVNPEYLYVGAAFHDIGICEGRETHHIVSGRMIRENKVLPKWFNPDEIELIAQAAEDHRASSDSEPRTIYGKILAESDRQIVPEIVIKRTVEFGLAHYPNLDKEGQWQRTCEHIAEKYAEGGYLKLWIPESPNAARLKELRKIISNKTKLRNLFEKYYDEYSE